MGWRRTQCGIKCDEKSVREKGRIRKSSGSAGHSYTLGGVARMGREGMTCERYMYGRWRQ